MCLWECGNCGTERVCDPLAGDDWGGEWRAVGPDCPECEGEMDFVEEVMNGDD